MSSSKPTGNNGPPRRRPAPSTQPVVPPYNPLLDKNLRQFFSSEGVQRQLYNIGLIDSDGRILNVGNSSGKLSVVDKEIKRIEQQEDDLAKEEENLRARVRELRLQRFEQEQQLRRLAIIKEEERIRQEIIRLLRESNHGTITNAPLASNSIINNNLNPASNPYLNNSVSSGGIVVSSSSSSSSSSLYPLPLASSMINNPTPSSSSSSLTTTTTRTTTRIHSSPSIPEIDNETGEYGSSSSSSTSGSPGYYASVASSSSPHTTTANHRYVSPTSSITLASSEYSSLRNYSNNNNDSPSSSPSVSNIISNPETILQEKNVSLQQDYSSTSIHTTEIPSIVEDNTTTITGDTSSSPSNSTQISSDLLEMLRNRSEQTGVILPTTPAMHAKRVHAPNQSSTQNHPVVVEEDNVSASKEEENNEEKKDEQQN